MRRIGLAGLGILLSTVMVSVAPAWALCDGVTDDTAAIQAAIQSRTPLPVGSCLTAQGVTVGAGQALLGQGPGLTYLLGTGVGADVVTVTAATARVENLQIGRFDWPTVLRYGIAVTAAAPFDRVLIRNVHISGKYSIAFLCQNAVSSLMEFVQIWNFQPNTMAAAWLGCSDWTNVQVEVHEQAASDVGGAAIWLWNGSSAINFFGGNASFKTGSGGQYVIGPGGTFYGTTFFQEP